MKLRKGDRYFEIAFSDKTGYPMISTAAGRVGEEDEQQFRWWEVATMRAAKAYVDKAIADKLAKGWVARGARVPVVAPHTPRSAAPLCRIVATTASLVIVAGDAELIATWDAVERDHASINKLVTSAAFLRKGACPVAVSARRGQLFRIEGSTGYASLYRAGDRLALIEPDAEYWIANRTRDMPSRGELIAMFAKLALAPLVKPVALGDVEVGSGVLGLGDVWADYTVDAAKLRRAIARPPAKARLGEDDTGLAISVTPGRYRIARGVAAAPWDRRTKLGIATITRAG